ncbi:MAG: zinc ABC transporter substrate-binding protein [Actinomycetota bacterium]
MRRARTVLAAIVLVQVMVFAASCSPGSDEPSDLGSDGSLSVVASFYPLAEATERVGGAPLEVVNLTPPGVEPHDLELSPDQVEQIATADLVLYMGQGFQPAVEEAVAAVAEGETLDVLDGMTLRPGTEEAEAVDPHVWLSPVLMQDIVDRVATSLEVLDPDRSAIFAANARTYDASLAALDEEFRTGLQDCDRRLLVSAHAAFGYLAAEYDLQQEAISGLSPEAEPSAEQLASIVEVIRAQGVTTVYTEALVSPKLAQTLADEASVTTAVLDPLEGLTQAQVDAGEGYASVMRDNLAALRDGLGCS